MNKYAQFGANVANLVIFMSKQAGPAAMVSAGAGPVAGSIETQVGHPGMFGRYRTGGYDVLGGLDATNPNNLAYRGYANALRNPLIPPNTPVSADAGGRYMREFNRGLVGPPGQRYPRPVGTFPQMESRPTTVTGSGF